MQLYRKNVVFFVNFQDRHFLSKSHDVYLLPINETAQTPEASREGGGLTLLRDCRTSVLPFTPAP